MIKETNENSGGSGGDTSQIEADIAQNTADIATVTNTASTNSASILTNITGISQNSGDIATNQSIIAGLQSPALTTVSGTAATSTLNQLSGVTWAENTLTSAATGDINLSTTFTYYISEGTKRRYFVRFYLDQDNAFTFEVTGARDVIAISVQGFSLGSGDFASRMVIARRTAPNVISVNRDDNNDADMFIDLTFTVFM